MTTSAVEHVLDARDLEPPEPLERALQVSASLGPGEYLRMLLHREPFPLYPLLDQRGFCWHTVCQDENRYNIYVWRRGDKVAERNRGQDR